MNIINENNINNYCTYLANEERAPATIEKYTRSIRAFASWAGRAGITEITKDAAVGYKRRISEIYGASSVNAAIAALNSFFRFMDWDVRLKPLKIQRQIFRAAEKELTRIEYERLLGAARKSEKRIYFILQTICSTGIRVSELSYIILEAVRRGRAVITNKGKTRIVFLPEKLQAALLQYAKERGITAGCIFITRSGRPVDRRDVWASMKKLCPAAGVPEEKAYPHNLRRLFAREFYGRHKDVVRLADVLGHASVNTTRIYTMESGAEHRRLVDGLGLAVGW